MDKKEVISDSKDPTGNKKEEPERADQEEPPADKKDNLDSSDSKESTESTEGPESEGASGNISTTDKDSDSDEEIESFLAAKLLESLKFSTERILSDTSIDGVVQYIKDHPNLRIITMVGAGISTAAGIPDFRSPGTGIYSNLQKYNLPYPNAIFELEYFSSNPEPFYQLAAEIFPGSYKPTKSHYFIRLLQEKKLLLRHFTQNIDNLDRLCGIEDERLIEAHGTFHTSHCINKNCKAEYTVEWLQEKVRSRVIPKCTKCESVVKPDIVFFGETLPKKFYNNIGEFEKCDLLIIMGSSLAVEPFASIATMVKRTCPRLMINATYIGTKLGFRFKVPNNGRDVLWIGDCDSGCQLLVDKLGWRTEFEELLEKNSAS